CLLSTTDFGRLGGMEIRLYAPPASPPRVPAAAVRDALDDARSPAPAVVSRPVALSVARGADRTARLRLERLARVVMATDSRITDPAQVWAADWTALPTETFEALDRGIGSAWSSPATRNAHRDAVRAVVRESLNAGLLTHDQAQPALNALRPEKVRVDPEKQARGHVPRRQLADTFTALAADPSPLARRDAAVVALMAGAGLRRGELSALNLADLDDGRETLVVHGKGDRIRSVPLSPGTRRAVTAWLRVRGAASGALLCPLSRTVPRTAETGRRMSVGAIAKTIARRFGDDVATHDLRRTFVGDALDSGADLSVVSQLVGHTNPATTAGYDRRGHTARRAAVDGMHLLCVDTDDVDAAIDRLDSEQIPGQTGIPLRHES